MRKDAFTFVEILVSLAICSLLVGTICSALIHVTRLERRTDGLRETAFLLHTLACSTYLAVESPDEIADRMPTKWLVSHDQELLDDDADEVPWLTWNLAPSDDKYFAYAISIRDGMGPWR